MPPKDKLSFASLGLNSKVPESLLKTRNQKKEEKFFKKKEQQQATKAAFEELSKQREIIQKHKDFVQEEAAEAKREKEAHKRSLQAEHIAAQNARKAVDKKREQEQREVEKEVVAQKFQEIEAEKEKYKEAERLIQEEIAAQIKVAKPAVHIPVARTEAIQKTRDQLPVLAEEQPIIEAIIDNPSVLVCGETGSGKTTQIPQFLWEAGFGHEEGRPFGRQGVIAVTEPRRVAAVSMAKRVAEELNEPFGTTVCYHVRYDNNLSPECKLKFMTEGILLKEIQSDFLLRQYSAVVVDEAHERSVACDVLVGLLSRIVELRRDMSLEQQRRQQQDPSLEIRDEDIIAPLKIVIMSATMRVSDFRDNTRLFPRQPPLLNVEARRFPVTNHFARNTELFKYIQEAFKKVKQIHKKLPPGGILIFLSTQREIETLCEMLREYYAKTRVLYESNRYGKHAQLHTRSKEYVDAKQKELKRKGAVDEQQDPGEMDEYGLGLEDYGLEGDEDGPAAPATGTQSNNRGLADDYDYGQDVGLEDSDDEADDAERRIAEALDAASRAMGSKAARGSESVTEKKAKKSSKKEPKTTKSSKTSAKSSILQNEADDDWGDDEGNTFGGPSADEDGDDAEFEADDADEAQYNEEEADEGAKRINEEDEEDGSLDTMHILPLYALLDPQKQQQVFQPPPDGKRLCVIATNVAETSITIPNIRYVVDAGRVKMKTIEDGSGASAYRIEWTSQASAEQRAGRAGRTGPGHCYRLYSTAVFSNRMPKHATPEILRTPLESVVLMMKHLRIDHVGRFPFPTPPRQDDIAAALRHLVLLKAVEGRSSTSAVQHRITPLGTFLMKFPVPPRFAKMLFEILRVASTNVKLHSFICSIVAVIATTTDNFRAGAQIEKEVRQNQNGLLHAGSDLITALRAFAVFVAKPTVPHCNRYNLVHKTMTEAAQLRKQLEQVMNETRGETHEQSEDDVQQKTGGKKGSSDANLAALQESTDGAEGEGMLPEAARAGPSAHSAHISVAERYHFTREGAISLTRDEEVLLRKAFVVGLWDQVARRASVHECTNQGYKYNDSKTSKVPYYDMRTGKIVYVHPTSAVARTQPPPEFLVYCTLVRTKRKPEDPDEEKDVFLGPQDKAKVIATERTFMKGLTTVTKVWLDQLGFDEDEIKQPR